jgi:hypothetical protein
MSERLSHFFSSAKHVEGQYVHHALSSPELIQSKNAAPDKHPKEYDFLEESWAS